MGRVPKPDMPLTIATLTLELKIINRTPKHQWASSYLLYRWRTTKKNHTKPRTTMELLPRIGKIHLIFDTLSLRFLMTFKLSLWHSRFSYVTQVIVMTFENSSCHSSYPQEIWELLMSFKLFSWRSRFSHVIHIIVMPFNLLSWHSRFPHIIRIFSYIIWYFLMTFKITHVIQNFITIFEMSSRDNKKIWHTINCIIL